MTTRWYIEWTFGWDDDEGGKDVRLAGVLLVASGVTESDRSRGELEERKEDPALDEVGG